METIRSQSNNSEIWLHSLGFSIRLATTSQVTQTLSWSWRKMRIITCLGMCNLNCKRKEAKHNWNKWESQMPFSRFRRILSYERRWIPKIKKLERNEITSLNFKLTRLSLSLSQRYSKHRFIVTKIRRTPNQIGQFYNFQRPFRTKVRKVIYSILNKRAFRRQLKDKVNQFKDKEK